MRKNLELEDLGDLLERSILAVLATYRKDGTILMSPVWHEWTDGGFSIQTWAKDIKSRNLARDPRATVLVAENDPPYRGVEVSGEATVEAMADPMPMIRRLARRYVGEEAGDAYAETFQGVALELIRLRPGAMRAWDFDAGMD
jgi:PPOX class probable F420-dependent enzyme